MANERVPDFAELLRRARRAAGLTQEELAERSGLSVRGISALERGVNRTPRRDTLDLLADALQLNPEQRRQWERLRHQRSAKVAAGPAASRRERDKEAILTNLPPPLTRFFGRTHEFAYITQMLEDPATRLVTLTGPGGTGKTRLAFEVSRRRLADYPDGVVFVDLAPVTDPDLVLPTIATTAAMTLGLHPRADQPTMSTLVTWLQNKRLLLVLDNLEQLLPVAPQLADLVSRCPSVRVLATSRAPLRLRAEREYPVAPFPLPTSDALTEHEIAAASEAAQLFLDRAQAARPNFSGVVEDALVVARICQRLDGLPLAIELAAACIRLFPPKAMLERLEHHLPLVMSGHRDAPARQRTLRDTIAWSYNLLEPDERTVFRRLSLFRGGWTMEAAEAVAGGDRASGAIDVLGATQTLVEHSLIQSWEALDGSVRFSMLETIRAFGLEQLAAHVELDETHQRHADYLLAVFSGSERDWHSPHVQTWFERGDVEAENVRLALTWAITHQPVTALRLAVELAWYWFMRGASVEAQQWLERTLESADELPDTLRVGALYWIGALATSTGDFQTAHTRITDALALYQQLGDAVGIARGLFALGRNAMWSGDDDQAVSLYQVAADHFRDLDDPWLSTALGNLGASLASAGRLEQANAVLDDALQQAQRHGGVWDRALILENQSLVALRLGDLPRARQKLQQSLLVTQEVHDPRYIAQALEYCAWLAIQEAMPEQAARLLGAVSRLRETIGVPVLPSVQRDYDDFIPIALAQIGATAWDAAWSHGRRLSPAEAIELALRRLN